MTPHPAVPPKFVQAAGQPQVYWVNQPENTKVYIPTPDALERLGWTGAVSTVPADQLANLRTVVIPASCATPPSLVYAVQWSKGNPKWFPRREVPGETLPNGNHLVSLYGRFIQGAEQDSNLADPDLHGSFVPDASCLTIPGVDPARFFTVGDILNGVNQLTEDARACAATPAFHVEHCGWPGGLPDPSLTPRGNTPPSDWSHSEAGFTWPWDFRAVQSGFVRISGVLVTDEPHIHQGADTYKQAARDWQGSLDDYDESIPSRYTEFHPPDQIIAAPAPAPWPHAGDVVGIAVSARTISPAGEERALTIDLKPTTPQPPEANWFTIDEIVLPATYQPSIIEGNPQLNGAQIDRGAGGVATVHVKVRADGLQGHAGRFAAIYILRWVHDPAAPPANPQRTCAELQGLMDSAQQRISDIDDQISTLSGDDPGYMTMLSLLRRQRAAALASYNSAKTQYAHQGCQ